MYLGEQTFAFTLELWDSWRADLTHNRTEFPPPPPGQKRTPNKTYGMRAYIFCAGACLCHCDDGSLGTMQQGFSSLPLMVLTLFLNIEGLGIVAHPPRRTPCSMFYTDVFVTNQHLIANKM